MTLFTDPLAAFEQLKIASQKSSRPYVIVRVDGGYSVIPRSSAAKGFLKPLAHMGRGEAATQWTTDEIRELISLRSTGSDLDECAVTLSRTKNSCSKAFNKHATDVEKAMARAYDYARRSESMMRAWA